MLQLAPSPNDWFSNLAGQSFNVLNASADPSAYDPAASYPGGYVDDPSDTGGSADDGGQLAYNDGNGDDSDGSGYGDDGDGGGYAGGGDDGGGYGGGDGGGGGGGDCGPLEMAAFTPAPATSTASTGRESIVLTDVACG